MCILINYSIQNTYLVSAIELYFCFNSMIIKRLVDFPLILVFVRKKNYWDEFCTFNISGKTLHFLD